MKRDAPHCLNQCGGDVPHRDIPEQRGQSSGAARGPGSGSPPGALGPPSPPEKKKKLREYKKEKKEKERKKERGSQNGEGATISAKIDVSVI